MIGWLLNLTYVVAVLAASPVLILRAIRHGKYRRGWSEKLMGQLPRSRDDKRGVVWVHAVSVGEVLQLRTIIPRLRQSHPDVDVLITATTSTGHAVAREAFPDCRVAYFPLDFTWSTRTALSRVRPDLVVLVELELWPNIIRAVSAAGVPLVLINGRMSLRSYRGYRRIRWIMRPLLRRFAAIAVQTEEYAARLTDLGAPCERVQVTGSVKFDGVGMARENPQTRALRREFAIREDEKVFIAGSTHDPEERIALESYLKLRTEFNDLRLILVPRHAERFDEVAELIRSRGVPLLRRSRTSLNAGLVEKLEPTDPPVCLLDTLGELSACWGLADVAFVGGSLTARGGQNMMEPAGYGAAVIVGPNTQNFRDVVHGLQSCGGIHVIDHAEALCDAVRTMLNNPLAARRQGMAARKFVLDQQGATDRTLHVITALLSGQRKSRAA